MTRGAVVLALVLGGSAGAQNPSGVAAPRWRQTFNTFLTRPPGSFNTRDLQQLASETALAGQSCIGAAPGDYEANRELARRMAAYLATIEVASRDQQWNRSLRGVTRSLAMFPCAYPVTAYQQQASPEPTIPAEPGEPPFSLRAPELRNVPAADQDTAKDLRDRYNLDAANAATTWKNAEVLRESLAANGMLLNSQTAASVGRLKLGLDRASDALRDHNWDAALSALQSAEYERQSLIKVVGG